LLEFKVIILFTGCF